MDTASRIPSSEITPPSMYFNRRQLLRAAALGGTVLATGAAYRILNPLPAVEVKGPQLAGVTAAPTTQGAIDAGFRVNEAMTPLASIENYNNYYEFSTSKEGVAPLAANFKVGDWKVMVDGLCAKPRTFDLDGIRKIGAPEERIYRMRCVEAWSMVIPWDGLPLAKLLAQVEPTSAAKYVAFTTLLDPKRMPGQNSTDVLPWPYVEGLRMDEAMHPLTILATGLYGQELPPQDGAPIRLVVPWKYGFKGIKAIVKITLTDQQPPTTWNLANPPEYGFYANVNPHHDHPRWSQATEHRIGESGRRPTLMFNGYAEQVGSLYAGMDLDQNF